MSWASAFKVIIAALVSVCCAGGIIVLLAKGLATRMADRVAEKLRAQNKAELEQALKDYEARLDKSGHVSRAYYDIEVATYQELCSSFFVLMERVYWLFPTGPDAALANTDRLQRICIDRLDAARKAYDEAFTGLGSKAAFIKQEIYEEFKAMLTSSSLQIRAYPTLSPWAMKTSAKGSSEEQKLAVQRTQEIDHQWEQLLDGLRDYISKLKTQILPG